MNTILPPPHRYQPWDDLTPNDVSKQAHDAVKQGISTACIVLTMIIIFVALFCIF